MRSSGRATRSSSSSTTWRRCAAPTGSSTSVPTRASKAAACSTAGRRRDCARCAASHTARYLFAARRAAHARRRASRAAGSSCAASPATTCTNLDARFPLGVLTIGGRRLRLGQVEPGQPGAGRAGLPPPRPRARGRRRRADERRADRRRRDARPPRCRHGTHPAPRPRRPEADRPDAALQPRHLHGPVRRRAQDLRGDACRALAPLRRRTLLVQRRQGTVRDLRGRRLRQRRTALHAERLRALPDLPRRALQRARRSRSPGAARTSPTCCA